MFYVAYIYIHGIYIYILYTYHSDRGQLIRLTLSLPNLYLPPYFNIRPAVMLDGKVMYTT